MITQHIDGLPVRLAAPADLSFLGRWGSAFTVLDQQDSGNLCLGLDGPEGRVFVKYAGARTLRYEGDPAAAVSRLRSAAEPYTALAHRSLVRLLYSVDVADGHALVFEWTDAVSLGRQYDQTHLIRALPLSVRERIVDDLFDFGDHVVRQGWVAIDFYDGSIMVDLTTGAVVVCDIDVFAPAPVINTMGRMWGSTRFMSAEEYQLGAAIDEVSNVVTLGGLAFALLGDSDDKDIDTWESSPELFTVASRACQLERADRWSSVAELRAAWLAARAGCLHT